MSAIANDADLAALHSGAQGITHRSAFPQVHRRPRLQPGRAAAPPLPFAGDIRATGDVLIDQLVQMHRSGFSSAVLAKAWTPPAQRQFAALAASTRAMPSRARSLPGGRMSAVTPAELARVNAELGRDAAAWCAGRGPGQPAIVTTNFRPFEAVILHMVTRAARRARGLDGQRLQHRSHLPLCRRGDAAGLNLKIYLPLRSRAHTARPWKAPRRRWTTRATRPSRKK
jgi:hypothetical protein